MYLCLSCLIRKTGTAMHTSENRCTNVWHTVALNDYNIFTLFYNPRANFVLRGMENDREETVLLYRAGWMGRGDKYMEINR